MYNPRKETKIIRYQYYTLEQLKALDHVERRKAYTQLRRIANKRIKRGGGWNEDQKPFKSLKELDKENGGLDFQRLRRLHEFVVAKTTLPSQMKERIRRKRKKSMETLHRNGYGFINDDNFDDFTSFMEFFRARKYDKIYDSSQVAEVFNATVKSGIGPEELQRHFKSFMSHRQELNTMAKENQFEGKRYGFSDFQKRWRRKGKGNNQVM